MEKIIGPCAICGQLSQLTFEHIPPKATFKGKILKRRDNAAYLGVRGVGLHSLCGSCNNNTGIYYGRAYKHAVDSVCQKLAQGEAGQGIRVKDLYPQRFIKQILSLFCSVNGEAYFKRHPELGHLRKPLTRIRHLVHDRDGRGLREAGFRLTLEVTTSPQIRLHPMTQLKESGLPVTFSEINAYPFNFVLYFDPAPDFDMPGWDITSFADAGYHDKGSFQFPVAWSESEATSGGI